MSAQRSNNLDALFATMAVSDHGSRGSPDPWESIRAAEAAAEAEAKAGAKLLALIHGKETGDSSDDKDSYVDSNGNQLHRVHFADSSAGASGSGDHLSFIPSGVRGGGVGSSRRKNVYGRSFLLRCSRVPVSHQIPVELQHQLDAIPELRRRPESLEGILLPSVRRGSGGSSSVASGLPSVAKASLMLWDAEQGAWVPRSRPKREH